MNCALIYFRLVSTASCCHISFFLSDDGIHLICICIFDINIYDYIMLDKKNFNLHKADVNILGGVKILGVYRYK